MSSATKTKERPRQASPNLGVLDKQPPCNLEAERSVIGSILLLPDVCDDVAVKAYEGFTLA